MEFGSTNAAFIIHLRRQFHKPYFYSGYAVFSPILGQFMAMFPGTPSQEKPQAVRNWTNLLDHSNTAVSVKLREKVISVVRASGSDRTAFLLETFHPTKTAPSAGTAVAVTG